MCENNTLQPNNIKNQLGGGLLENLSVPLGLLVFTETIEDDTSKTLYDIQYSGDLINNKKIDMIKKENDVIPNSLFDNLYNLVSLDALKKKTNNITKKQKLHMTKKISKIHIKTGNRNSRKLKNNKKTRKA